MLLPPLGYRGDEREIEAFYRAVAEAAGLPLMAYNNPEASGTDMRPALIARLGRRIERLVAVKECSGDVRRIPAIIHAAPTSTCWWAATTGRSRASAAGAVGWVTGVADVAPRECVELYELCRAGELDAARAVYRRLLPLARFDMTPKLVQYFKAAMDAVGLAGGSVRPPRLELTDAEHAELERRARGAAGGTRGVRAARYFAAVDSHTEGMPTRVITGGVGPIPGSTHARAQALLRARDGRPAAAADARAARPRRDVGLDPPAADAARRRLGRAVHRGQRLPADVRARDDRRSRPCSSRPAWCEVTEPETVVRLEVPAGLVEARVAVQDGRARSVTLRNVPAFLHARDLSVEVPGLGEVAYDLAFGGNFFAIVDAASVGPGGRLRSARTR